MKRLITWRDVEIDIGKKHKEWPQSWRKVDVYNDSVIIGCKDVSDDVKKDTRAFLSKLFGGNFNVGDDTIILDVTGNILQIMFECTEFDKCTPQDIPMFGNVLVNDIIGNSVENITQVPKMIAFHSYKGGVGRTFSLISFLREYSSFEGKSNKVLIIDVDAEAPGLTWSFREERNRRISYFDLLGLMQEAENEDKIIDNIVAEISKSTIRIQTNENIVEQYFVPLYRDENQLYDGYFEHTGIIDGAKNKFIVTDFILKIARRLGVDIVLVDLRAGISEYSSPYIFDSRVDKIFVTTTSFQSLCGTNNLLRFLMEHTKSKLNNSSIFMNFMQRTLDKEKLVEIMDKLYSELEYFCADGDDLDLDALTVKFYFNSQFIGLGNVEEVVDLLKNKDFSDVMKNFVFDNYLSEYNALTEDITPSYLENVTRLRELARNEKTAESNYNGIEPLVTESIRNLGTDFINNNPRVVVLGAKGSGKTYLYKKIIQEDRWENFCSKILKNKDTLKKNFGNTRIVPLVWTQNVNNIVGDIKKRIEKNYEDNNICVCNIAYLNKVRENLQDYLEGDNVNTIGVKKILGESVLGYFRMQYASLDEATDALIKENKKYLFVVDGLEDLVGSLKSGKEENWKIFIRTLCQDFINELHTLKNDNIGLIVFVRKDLVNDSIKNNFMQFGEQYKAYELKWNQTEALRLALWIVKCVDGNIAKDINVETATYDIITKNLEQIWGRKLGKNDSKEAYSARWILASLSDFNGQLQARDIIRFLFFASSQETNKNSSNLDRWISANSIRNAIPECASEKVLEIEAEIKSVSNIFSILRCNEIKNLPLAGKDLNLNSTDISILEGQGFIKLVDNLYYLPEILRTAFGYKYSKGARPKVLGLLLDK